MQEWVYVARKNEPEDLPIPYLDDRYRSREDAVYVHRQLSPSNRWRVQHDQGRVVDVLVILDDGQISEGDVEYDDGGNVLWVVSEYLITGRAYCFL